MPGRSLRTARTRRTKTQAPRALSASFFLLCFPRAKCVIKVHASFNKRYFYILMKTGEGCDC